jgi:hypothetical protein
MFAFQERLLPDVVGYIFEVVRGSNSIAEEMRLEHVGGRNCQMPQICQQSAAK